MADLSKLKEIGVHPRWGAYRTYAPTTERVEMIDEPDGTVTMKITATYDIPEREKV